MARADHVRRKIVRDHAAGGNDRVSANGHSRADERTGPNPNAVFHHDWAGDEPEMGVGPVMVARAHESALRNTNVVADADGGQVENPGFLAEPGVRSQRQAPGEGDFCTRLDEYARTHPRSEPAQEKAAQPIERQHAVLEKGTPREQPRQFPDPARAAPEIVIGKF